MTYTVTLEERVEKFYNLADKSLAKKLAKCFKILEKTPRRHPNIKPLRGNFKGKYRYRVGKYRVIYTIDDQAVEVLVADVRPRGSAYD